MALGEQPWQCASTDCHLGEQPWHQQALRSSDRHCTAAGAGVFGVELFLLADGTLLLNEVAPRPHNSGHYTIEACATSQYEQHLRAILGWPLGDPSLVVGAR